MDYCCIPVCHDTKVVPVATIDNLCKSGMLMEAQNLLIVHGFMQVQVQSLTFFLLYDPKINVYCLSGKLDEAMKHLNVYSPSWLENWC